MMGCNGRFFLIAICVLQLLATAERQVFDFLGFMWAPVIGNFLQLLFCIICILGACQFRQRIIIIYAVWTVLWVAWNAFNICFYLQVGELTRSDPYLNIGTNHVSWWAQHGIGCEPAATVNITTTTSAASAEYSSGCFLAFYYVEVIHAGVQCLLGLIGFIVACVVIHIFAEEDDSSQPVHDELEYIKMRYRSPARQSFRVNKTYNNLSTSRSNTLEKTSSRSNRQAVDGDLSGNVKRAKDRDPLVKDDGYSGREQLVYTQTSSPSTPLKNASDFDCSRDDSHECSTLQTRIA